MHIEDKDLGKVRLISNARAGRIIVRYRDGMFQLTHPTFVSETEIVKTIEEMKPRLLNLKEKASAKFIFTEDTEFKTLAFDVLIRQNTLNNVYANLKDGILSISYPQGMRLESDQMQVLIKKTIENACRAEAARIFPNRVRQLAQIHGFSVLDIKINKSRSRWGSCSSKKNINLSYFCMMLPSHLLDFVILHELCHTREMNHGARFWAQLDKVSNNRAKELTKELNLIKLKW